METTVGEAKVSMAILAAAFAGHADVVDLLLARGADPNARLDLPEGGWERTTVLTFASEDGYPGLVRLLLKRGADPNARDKIGLTPVAAAAVTLMPVRGRCALTSPTGRRLRAGIPLLTALMRGARCPDWIQQP